MKRTHFSGSALFVRKAFAVNIGVFTAVVYESVTKAVLLSVSPLRKAFLITLRLVLIYPFGSCIYKVFVFFRKTTSVYTYILIIISRNPRFVYTKAAFFTFF